MYRKTLIALLGAGALGIAVAGAALAAGSGPAVRIRIEGLTKTLLLPRSVRARRGWITKYGAPRGKCPARSAQGALDVATHGHWKGKWYPAYHEYFITSIKGEKPSGHNYWGIFVNDKTALVGACDIKLKRGERLLFAVTDGTEYPAELRSPHRVVAGQTFQVKLLGYNKAGQSRLLKNVTITGNGISPVKTNHDGVAKIRDTHQGRLVLRTSPNHLIRTEAVVHVTT